MVIQSHPTTERTVDPGMPVKPESHPRIGDSGGHGLTEPWTDECLRHTTRCRLSGSAESAETIETIAKLETSK